MTTINPYGQRALRYFREHCPNQLAGIPETEREQFFTELGNQLEAEVTARIDQLMEREQADAPETGFRQNLGKRNMAKLVAEETVFDPDRTDLLPQPEPTPNPQI